MVLTVLGLLALAVPYLGSAWNLAAGARLVVGGADLPAAVHSLEAALRLDPRSLQAYRWLTRANLALGAPDRAATTIQEALALAPDHPVLQMEAGDVYDELGDAAEAVAHYEAGGMGDRPSSLLVNYLRVADQMWTSGNVEGAAAIWRDRVLGRGIADLYATWRVLQYCGLAGHVGEDCVNPLGALPLQSIRPSEDQRLVAYQAQAIAGLSKDGMWPPRTKLNVLAYLARRGEVSATDTLLRTMAELDPTDADVQYYLGELYRRCDLLGAADGAFRRAIGLDPAYAIAYVRLGMLSELMYKADGNTSHLIRAAQWYLKYHEIVARDPLALERLADLCEQTKCGANTWRSQLEHYLEKREPQFAVNQRMPDGRLFVGYDVDDERLARDEPVTLWLFWSDTGYSASAPASRNLYRAGDRWVQVVEDARNLLPNGSFEIGTAPVGFPRDAHGAGPETRQLMTDKRGGHSTTVAALINGQTWTQTSYVSAPFATKTDRLYLEAGWVRGEAANVYFGQRWTMSDSKESSRDYVVHSVSPVEWTHYAGLVTPRAGAGQAQIWLSNHRSVGRAYFDNVVFVEVGRVNAVR